MPLYVLQMMSGWDDAPWDHRWFVAAASPDDARAILERIRQEAHPAHSVDCLPAVIDPAGIRPVPGDVAFVAGCSCPPVFP